MNKITRRLLLQAGGSTVAFGLGTGSATAQGSGTYPVRPIMLVVPAPAGGATDAIARALTDIMSKDLGQPFVIDNRSGGAGVIGAQAVARAAPDGYTLLLTYSSPIYYAPYLVSKLPYDPRRDFTFLSHLGDGGLVIAANKDVPVKDVRELVAWVKQKGKGKVSYGSYGNGSASHLLSAFLNESRDLGMQHIPYRGEAPMLQDMLRGEIPFAIGSITTLAPHFASQQLRPLAIFDEQRLATLPDVPTMKESGFTEREFVVIGGVILLGPAGLPQAVAQKVEAAARAAMATPQMRARFQVNGLVPVGNSGADARKAFEASGPLVERLVRISGAKID